MAESDFPIFRTKKRKIEEENELDDPLLTFPLAENLFPDSQPIEGKTVASEIFDLTLVELEKEKNEALVVLKKVELQFVTDLLHKCDKNMCDRLYLVIKTSKNKILSEILSLVLRLFSTFFRLFSTFFRLFFNL